MPDVDRMLKEATKRVRMIVKRSNSESELRRSLSEFVEIWNRRMRGHTNGVFLASKVFDGDPDTPLFIGAYTVVSADERNVIVSVFETEKEYNLACHRPRSRTKPAIPTVRMTSEELESEVHKSNMRGFGVNPTAPVTIDPYKARLMRIGEENEKKE